MSGARSKPNGIVVLLTVAVVAVLAVGLFAARGSTPLAARAPLDERESAPTAGGAAPAAIEPRVPIAPQPARPAEPDPAAAPATQTAAPTTVVNPPPLHSASEVDAYLMTLESRARQNHRATAAEVEPGIKAIMRLAPLIGPNAAMEKLREFNKTMAELGKQAE